MFVAFNLLPIIAVMIILPMEIHSYRIQGSENETLAFIPYEKGFVGRREETPAIPVRTNQGYESVSIAMDIGRNRLQNCPGMVGPLDDGKFYCTSRLHGYCDARSGACFCNEGYAGDSCEDCDPTHHLIGDLCYEKMFCPNDCSNSGQCDYLTGTCACNEYREGQDCSEFTCSKHHAYCTQCDDSRCLQCIQGYGIKENEDLRSQCERCPDLILSLDANTCLECGAPRARCAGRPPYAESSCLWINVFLRTQHSILCTRFLTTPNSFWKGHIILTDQSGKHFLTPANVKRFWKDGKTWLSQRKSSFPGP